MKSSQEYLLGCKPKPSKFIKQTGFPAISRWPCTNIRITTQVSAPVHFHVQKISESDFKMRFLNKENVLSSTNTKCEGKHNRQGFENGSIWTYLCISVWLHIVRTCGLLPSFLELHNSTHQCHIWWSKAAPAAVKIWRH